MKQIIYVLFVFDLDGECKTKNKKQSAIVIKEICSWLGPWLGEYQILCIPVY